MSFTNLNEQFHIFSKSPVRTGQTLGSARNKSGHTVTSADVWADDIPAMFYAYTTTQKNSFELIASENDLCYDKQTDTLSYFKNNRWFNRKPLIDQEILFNANSAANGVYNDGDSFVENQSKGVIKFHKDKSANAITAENNNQSAGNGLTARIKKTDGTFISQFVSAMDKMVQGNPSSLYEPVVVYKGNTMEESAEDTTERKYISNSYSGIIQFHNNLPVNSPTGDYEDVSVSVFEYIGKKLNNTLSKISDNLNSEETNCGITIKQTNGLVNSLTVNGATVNDDGSLKEDTKNNVITGSEVQKMIDNVIFDFSRAGVNYQIVDNLPMPPNSNYKGVVHLVPVTSNSTEDNYYNEFICIDKDENTWAWEQIGTTKVDLSGFVSKEDLSKSDAIIWDLNDFVLKHANVEWVQNMIRSDITFIPHRTTFYPNSTSMSDAKNQWIQQAITDGNVSVQLVFPFNSQQTNEIIRQMFWQLDNENNLIYGFDNSISKKYIKSGLIVKYFTLLDDGNWFINNDSEHNSNSLLIDNDTEGNSYYPSYVLQTWVGKSKSNSIDFNWGTPNWNATMSDSFSSPINWTNVPNEQQMKLFKKFILENKNAIVENKSQIINSKLGIKINNCDASIHVSNTSATWGDSVGEIKLSKKYFTSGKINSIIIPHDYDTRWSNDVHFYLILQVYDSNDRKIETFISTNKDLYTTKLYYHFNFENCLIPEDYAYVKLSASSTNKEENRDYQEFRTVALRDKNNPDKNSSKVEDTNCYFTWLSNGNLNGGANRVANIITVNGINTEIQTDIVNDSSADASSISTTQAIKDYVDHVIENDSITEIINGGHITVTNKNEISVSTSDNIVNDTNTVPTTKAVYDFVNDQRVWDLNSFIYTCLRKRANDQSKYKWVEDYVLQSKNIYINLEEGYDLVKYNSRQDWINYVKSGNEPHSPLIFINDGYDVINGSDDDRHSRICDFVKMMFYQMDKDMGKNWMDDGSYSKKYLKIGLAIKYITFLSVDGNEGQLPNGADFDYLEGLKNEYIYPSTTISILSCTDYEDSYGIDSLMPIIQPITREDGEIIFNGKTHDYFTNNKNWSYLVTEQEMKLTRKWISNNFNTIKTSDEIIDDSTTVPTTKAVYDEIQSHVGDTNLHLTEELHNTIDELQSHVGDTNLHLTEELHDTIDELVVAEEYNDNVFDLSNLLYKNINKDWVEKIVILSIDTNSASPYKEYGIVVPGDIDIPYYEKFYPDSDSIYLELNNLQISDTPPTPIINAVGFDLSDVAKSAISEKIIQLSRIFWSKTKNGTITETIQNDFNEEVNKLKKSVPLKARWITDAKNGICKAPLSFQGSTHRRNEILRTFFYYLDQENGKTYAASDSYSRKYMRPGLTVKCMVAPDELVKPNKGDMTDEEYNDKYMYYTYIYFTFIGDRNRNLPLVNWQYIPSYLTIGWQPGYGYASTNESNGSVIPNENTTHPNRTEDAFSNGGCWSYLANEQKFYCLQTSYRELKSNKLDEIIAGDFISVENKNEISVKTTQTISDDDETIPTTKAVYDEIENLKTEYLKDVLVSEEYNDFVFDLSNIFYEQIGQPWAESILLLSGDCIEIPYKEYYYPNVGTLTITGITNGENPTTPVIQTSGFTLSEVGKNVITEKLIKEAKNGRVEQTIAALQADVPYKARWITDAKNKNIPTQVAFERVGNYVRATANEVLRMVFYNLDKQYGKQWGGDGSFSKRYIVPGLTYKCFTGPDKTFVSDNPDDENNYYTYCHNTWLGNLGGKTFSGSQGVTRYFEFNWDYIPDYLSFESILNQTGNRDVFRDPNYWDTTINEQQWDSMLIDHNNIKEKINSTEDEINAINENIDSVRQMIVETKYNTVYNSDISSSATTGSSTKTIAGVIFEPQSNVSTSKIEMRGITNPNSEVFHESFIYIWEDSTVDGETRVITSIQNPSKGKQNKIDKKTYEWSFETPFQFISGKTYYITWHSACRENAISPPNTPEKGYTPTFETYQLSTVSTGGVYVLNNDVQYFNNENIDRTTTVDLRLYQDSGEYEMRVLEKETVYPEASNNILVSQTTSQEGSLRGGYGIGFISNKTSKLDKIIIRGITNGSHVVQDAYAKIWKGETGEFVAASKFAVKPTVDEGETKQLIISSDNFADVTLEFNTLYLITFHDNRNKHSYETGYQWNYNCYQQNSDKFGIISGGGKQIQLDKTISPKVEIYSQSTTCIFIRPEDLSEIIEDISESIDDKIIDIIEEIEETETKISLEKFDDSLGLASNNNSNSKSCGIIIKVPETKKYNKISVYAKGINEGNDNSIGVKTWMILHEVQSDGSVKELCTSVENQNNAVTFSDNLEQRTYSFDTFTMYSDKTYYCEFVEKNEDGSIKEVRPVINVGLFNKDSSLQHLQLTEVLGVISSSYRNKGTWDKIYTSGSSTGEYTSCYKLEHAGNDIIHLRPVKNNVHNSNIILAGSSMVSTCDVDASFDSSKSEICIDMKDYQFDENGEDYLIIKTFYVDKETNTSGEIIQHHAIQNVMN